jgi:protein-disulfide isomerase
MKTDTLGLFITMSKGAATTGLAVLDPLCPACKGFDERIMASGIDQKVALSAVLFPLDSTRNWMVKESLHPGACAVSEAMLCDREKSLQILDWAFAEQERLRTTAKSDEAAVRRELEEKFPWVKGCLGTAAVKNKVNKSLRFAVQNALPLLTPQLFIGDKRVCDEDTDLGLEFAVDQMLKSQGASSSSSPGRTR